MTFGVLLYQVKYWFGRGTILIKGSYMETVNYIAARAVKIPETILGMPRSKACLVNAGEKVRIVDKILPYSTVEDYESVSRPY